MTAFELLEYIAVLTIGAFCVLCLYAMYKAITEK